MLNAEFSDRRPTRPTRPPCTIRRSGRRTISRRRERGVVLLIALIVLVSMTLAAIGLMRSGMASNRVAGNLASQQSATRSADIGVETAIAWLEQNSSGTTLTANIDIDGTHLVGYFASREDPAPSVSWESFWNDTLLKTKRVNQLPIDAAGNTVSYVIQRLCNSEGVPGVSAECDVAPGGASSEASSKGSLVRAILTTHQNYYRISVRVAGPRNATSFVQVHVAI